MRFNPCFKCICDKQAGNEICRIKKQTCPELPCTVQEINSDICCRKCKTCTYKGKTYSNGEEWQSSINKCTKLVCKEGVISEVTPECIATCEKPKKIPGQCCPVCAGCLNDHQVLRKRIIELDDPCVTCNCTDGNLLCTREKCPILVCQNPIKKPGLCCPVCEEKGDASSIQVSTTERMCNFHGKQLENLESFVLDKCTICECINGTVVCKSEKCSSQHACSKDNLVPIPDQCCPVCADQLKCRYMGRVYQNREVWYLKGCVECQCINGRNLCKREICRENIKCESGFSAGYKVGSCCLQCLPERNTCIGYGDPHYRTFDGHAYSYQGICKYTLVKDCSEKKLFSIISRNSGRYTNGFSWIKTITLNYANLTISLGQSEKIKINGRHIKAPFLYYPYIDIKSSKRYIYLTTKEGMEIKWDGDSYVEVSLPKQFLNRVCGLCGNFNGNPYDDFKVDNDKTLTVNEFGDYWRLKESKVCKRHVRLLNNPQLATCTGWRLFRAHKICTRAFSDRSISSCKWTVQTSLYFQDCLTDVCQCNFGRHNCECGAIRSYFARCSNFIPNLVWKKKDRCDSSCTGGSIYSSCGPSCQRTCQSINNLEPCENGNKCIAGCHCPVGFVWNEGKCIPPFQCPFT